MQSLDNQSTWIAGCFQINKREDPEVRIAIVIPARLNSERLPQKVMLKFGSLPMIEHVRRRALMNSFSAPVYVASGDHQILDTVNSFGGNCIETLREHSNGLSRVSEVAEKLDYSHYVILQGDELLALPSEIDNLIRSVKENPLVAIWNQTTTLTSIGELVDASIVKSIVNRSGEIISLFRKSPLISSENLQMRLISKICGLFAISHCTLIDICGKSDTPIQTAELIEQFKFIEYGFSIKSLPTKHNFPSVNIPEDLIKVEDALTHELQRKIFAEVLEYDA